MAVARNTGSRRSGAAPLVVLAVLVYAFFHQSQGASTDDDVVPEPMPVSAGRGWNPEISAVPGTLPKRAADVAAYATWVESARYALDLSSSYYGPPSDPDDGLRELAAGYPNKRGAVVRFLSSAAGHVERSNVALAKRRYKTAARELSAAKSDLRSAGAEVIRDLDRVESATGVLMIDHGATISTEMHRRSTKVIRWIDGDTVETAEGRVRLIGIDAAEESAQCTRDDDAKAFASYLAPPGTKVSLVLPESVSAKTASGEMLAYVELSDTVDVGYSLLLSRLAVARYDGLDKHQWHPRQKEYRAAAAKGIGRMPAGCAVDSATVLPIVVLGAIASDDEGDPMREALIARRVARSTFVTTVNTSAENISARVASARSWFSLDDGNDGARSSGSGGSGSFNIPGALCPTRFC